MSTNALEELPDVQALTASRASWRRTVETELKGAAFDKKLVTRTAEGIALQPLYTRAETAERKINLDTVFRPTARVFGGWEVAQEITGATPEEFNRRLREDLMGGQEAAVLVAASPARPDGLALDAAGALDAALAGVDLGAITLHLDAGANAGALATRFFKVAAMQGRGSETLRGSVTADPLAALAVAGALPTNLKEALDELAAWTARAASAAPELRTVGVDARVWAEAGGTAVHELAFALAAATEYLRALAARGVSLAVVVPRLRLTFGSGPQFLIEAAKFRAWRPLLARVVVALGGDAALTARAAVHATTTRWNKTRLDPHVNLLRATTEAFAAVLGGVDSLNVSPFDTAGGGGGESISRRIARNVHVLLAEEFGAASPADPAGGSWCVESLTDELARKAWALFQTIEAQGGFAAALRAGVPQKLVADAAREKAQAVGTRRQGLVGTNLFPNLKETPLALVAAASVAAPAAVWAQERITPVAAFRVAAGFEKLRDDSAAFLKRTGARPKVFLVKMGPVLQHKARADFSTGFFAPGGFDVVAKQAFATSVEAVTAAIESKAQVIVLCSTDETYPEYVPVFAAAVRAARPEATIVLAGLPAEDAVRDAYVAAGIDLFIHLRAPVEETLAQLLKKIGALA